MVKGTEKQGSLFFHLLDVGLNIVVIVAIVVGIRTFLVSPFQVDGNSMATTLSDNEYIIINKLNYHLDHPKRGDIVVFRPPHRDETFYVKRVIGVPGDEIIIQNGYVYIQENGSTESVQLEENYLDEQSLGQTTPKPRFSDPARPVTYRVPEEHYFVLGDNRNGSLDSRSFEDEDGDPLPYVPRENIKGKVWFVALPITKIHAFESPNYAL